VALRCSVTSVPAAWRIGLSGHHCLRRSAKKTTRSLDDVLQRSAAKLREGAEKTAD
jgi:hypothetical protein